jgi:hypothetical protein
VELDTSGWSGEGTFTQTLIDSLKQIDAVRFLRVEDAPATRSDADYNFVSNELFVAFEVVERVERSRRFGILPVRRVHEDKVLTLAGLEERLAELDGVGSPDYADEGMLQYLRTERIIPPYQTRGFKLVELVRLYEVGTEPRR